MQATEPFPLPEPDPDARAHSERVRSFLRARIDAAGGALSFAEYMQHALYAPGLGYYTAGNRKFGAGGDFVTAPEVSSLFGAAVARQIASVIARDPGRCILEFGAGTGKLAVDVLRRLATLDALPARYQILEVSPDLSDRQRTLLRAAVPALADRVEWLSDWPEDFDGVVLANEVLDALPAERFVIRAGHARQQCVAFEGGAFRFVEREPPADLAARIRSLRNEIGSSWPEVYTSEISPAAAAWMTDLAASLRTALVLLFDYGLPRHEYYAAERASGWLRCHYRHRAHNDPLILPGIQDITTWVDFTATAEAAAAAGLDVAGFRPQAQFLLANGLDEEFAGLGAAQSARLSRELKLLTLPGEMGEHFKCLALRAGEMELPASLEFGDQAHRL